MGIDFQNPGERGTGFPESSRAPSTPTGTGLPVSTPPGPASRSRRIRGNLADSMSRLPPLAGMVERSATWWSRPRQQTTHPLATAARHVPVLTGGNSETIKRFPRLLLQKRAGTDVLVTELRRPVLLVHPCHDGEGGSLSVTTCQPFDYSLPPREIGAGVAPHEGWNNPAHGQFTETGSVLNRQQQTC